MLKLKIKNLKCTLTYRNAYAMVNSRMTPNTKRSQLNYEQANNSFFNKAKNFGKKSLALALIVGSPAAGAVGGVKAADYQESHPSDSAPELVSGMASAVVSEVQEQLGSKPEVGGSHTIQPGEINTYFIARNLIRSAGVSYDINKLVFELKYLNPGLKNYPPEPGIDINIPKDFTSTTQRN